MGNAVDASVCGQGAEGRVSCWCLVSLSTSCELLAPKRKG